MTRQANRPYSGAGDLQMMIDLLVASRPAERITDYPSPVDLREILALGVVQDNTRLWLDDDEQVVGFAFVDQFNNLRFEADRRLAHSGIEPEMIAWGVERVRSAVQQQGEPMTLDASCQEDNVERIALLEHHGLVMQDVHALQMARSISEPIPAPLAPEGFTIRHVAGEHEAGALVALHRAAFGTEIMTVEQRLAMMRVPEYDPELDLLAIAPDGRFAAYCMCWTSREENERSGRNEGYTDPLATHPDFQRRGLARALLLTGFHKLRQASS